MKSLARERDKAEILRRLRTVRPDSVRRWGRMSAPQMICHLIDAMRMAMGNKPVTPATGLAQRTIIKGIALYAPLRWPAGIPTSPEIDQEIGGTGANEFRSRRRRARGARGAHCFAERTPRGRCIRCSAACPKPPGTAGPTSTWITTCGSSVTDTGGRVCFPQNRPRWCQVSAFRRGRPGTKQPDSVENRPDPLISGRIRDGRGRRMVPLASPRPAASGSLCRRSAAA